MFCVIACLALLASCCLAPDGLPKLPLCYFQRLTGLPCPGCGLTRSFCAISHGQVGAAWGFNPFGFLFYGLAVFFALRPLLPRVWPGYTGLEQRAARSKGFHAATILLLVAMVAFGFWRMLSVAGAAGAALR
ncbi:MAG: DUF2752 domain-containing protein [Planctomycetota bacterium]|nr:DUF2752 domain-containing protein [Planctomycetota bacterium]